jgi:hypothetical protein
MKKSTERAGWREFMPGRIVFLFPAALTLSLYGWGKLGMAMGLARFVVPGMAAHGLDDLHYASWMINGFSFIYFILVFANMICLLPFLPILFFFGVTMPGLEQSLFLPFLVYLCECISLYLFIQVPLQLYCLTMGRLLSRRGETKI